MSNEPKTPFPVTRPEAMHMLKCLGLQSCEKWDKKRIAEVLCTLNDRYDTDSDLKDAAAQATFNGIMTAIKTGQGIQCVATKEGMDAAPVAPVQPSSVVAALTQDVAAPVAANAPAPAWAPDDDLAPAATQMAAPVVVPSPAPPPKPPRNRKEGQPVDGVPNLPDTTAADAATLKAQQKEADKANKAKAKAEAKAKKKADREAAAKLTPKVRSRSGPPGTRVTSHFFLAGVVLARVGLDVGVSDDIVAELERLFGRSSYRQSNGCLRLGWQFLRGYLMTMQAEGRTIPTTPVPDGWTPPAALPAVETSAKPVEYVEGQAATAAASA